MLEDVLASVCVVDITLNKQACATQLKIYLHSA